MSINVIKHTLHKWGGGEGCDISSIYGGFGPLNTSITTEK